MIEVDGPGMKASQHRKEAILVMLSAITAGSSVSV